MMHWQFLSKTDAQIFRSTLTFISERLEERETVEWALALKGSDIAKRIAVIQALDFPANRKLNEPWGSAWRLIEEGWDYADRLRGESAESYTLQFRIAAGDRSGALIDRIVELVRPRIIASSHSKFPGLSKRKPSKPRTVGDLVSIEFLSGDLVEPSAINLPQISEVKFLIELGHDLDAAVTKGVDLALRVGRDAAEGWWRLGGLDRVYFAPSDAPTDDEDELDKFHTGIAPCVKLLHAVISRIAEINLSQAKFFIQKWRWPTGPLQLRLWAAFSRDSRLESSNEVGHTLTTLEDKFFWDLHMFPEIAELRAVRFSHLSAPHAETLLKRLKKGPPSSFWRKTDDKAWLAEVREFWKLRELLRLKVAGVQLHVSDQLWVEANQSKHDELVGMSRIDAGFPGSTKVKWLSPSPDNSYDILHGLARLKALEFALQGKRSGWGDDPASNAARWIDTQKNSMFLLSDLQKEDVNPDDYPLTWERLGWSLRSDSSPDPAPSSKQEDAEIAARVGRLILRLTPETIKIAIEGLSHWFDSWDARIGDLNLFEEVWLALWSISVEATNAKDFQDELSLDSIIKTSSSEITPDLDTLNTPSGRLVGAFLHRCFQINARNKPFSNPTLQRMRDSAIQAGGRAGLITRHRFLSHFSWFQIADPDWAEEYLVEPLLSKSPESYVLWRAIARRTIFGDVLTKIGPELLKRAADPKLPRETRKALAFSAVVEALHAYLEVRAPYISKALLTQMLREIDDEVRSHVGRVFQQFVMEMAVEKSARRHTPASLFYKAVTPFFNEIWPKERSIATPGLSRALADLPAASGSKFADAVNLIERYLVPFSSWSLNDYGLRGKVNDQPKLLMISDLPKAEALLKLLNLTVSSSDNVARPTDLDEALKRIGEVSPRLTSSTSFRRLATLTRN